MGYTTTIEFAKEVKNVIDDYWKLILSKDQLIARIAILFADVANRGFALRGSMFSTSFAKVLGKKRLSVLKETLISIDAELYNTLV